MDFTLPRLADTLVEGTVARWLRQPGEEVRRGEALVEIETDKVTSEVASPVDGVLVEILVAAGQTVPVGHVIARLDDGDQASPAQPAPTPAAGTGPRPAGERLAEHLRRSAAAVPQGACVRGVAAAGLARLPAAAAAQGVALAPRSRSDLALPALEAGQEVLLAAGAERDGVVLLTLCYDRRRFDDWAADRLLAALAHKLGG